MTLTEMSPAVTVGHFDPFWIKVVRGTLFGPFEYTASILQRMGGEAEDEEEVEDECLCFRAGADDSGTTELGISDSWMGCSGMGTNVCIQPDHDFKDLECSGVAVIHQTSLTV